MFEISISIFPNASNLAASRNLESGHAVFILNFADLPRFSLFLSFDQIFLNTISLGHKLYCVGMDTYLP